MLEVIFAVLFGLIIGSFLNVVILRYQTGRTLAVRSGCLSCGKKFAWFELLPVLSFFVQTGRCRGCRSKISWQYPLVELATGIIFALVAWHFGVRQPADWLTTVFCWLVASILIVITVYDLKHQIIPDRFVFSLMFFGLIWSITHNLLVGLFGGLAMALPLLVLWLISRGRWLGFGDVKLVFALGLFLNWQMGLSALVLAFWLGAIVGLLLIAWGKTRLWRKGKSYTMKSEVPFAPFLILGFWLVFFLSIDVLAFWQI